MNLAVVEYITKNWALAMMLKALPLVHFWSVLLLKEQNNDDLCQENVKNAGLISAKPIDFKRNFPFFTYCFLVKLAPKIPGKLAHFPANVSLKIPRNLTFLPSPIRRRRLNCLLELRDVVHKYFCSTFVMNKKRVNYPIGNLKNTCILVKSCLG